jgi:hypothetical protein
MEGRRGIVVFYYYLFVGTFAIIEVNLIGESTLSKSHYLVGRERGYLKIFFYISRGEHVKHFVIGAYL